MASLRIIRRRIRSVRNTSQITKAMEMVAASKMRRAQARVMAARPYSEHIEMMIADLAARLGGDANLHPLLEQRATRNRTGMIVITSDRGLCGALNSNVIRRATAEMLDAGGPGVVEMVTVGRRGHDYMARHGVRLQGSLTNLGDYPSIEAIRPAATIVMDDFVGGRIDAAFVVYPRFVNTLIQRVTVAQILPVVPAESDGHRLEYIFEPGPAEILSELLPRYVEVQIYQALLETIASEQSARMITMRNATDMPRSSSRP